MRRGNGQSGTAMMGTRLARPRLLACLVCLACLACLLLPSSLSAQSANAAPLSGGPILTSYGTPASGASVRVCAATAVGTPCPTTGVSLWSDANLTQPLTNPTALNSQGVYTLFTNAGGLYQIQIYANGSSALPYDYWVWAANGTSQSVIVINAPPVPGVAYSVPGAAGTGAAQALYQLPETYNSSTGFDFSASIAAGDVTATSFTGPLTGTASGNVPLTGGTMTGTLGLNVANPPLASTPDSSFYPSQWNFGLWTTVNATQSSYTLTGSAVRDFFSTPGIAFGFSAGYNPTGGTVTGRAPLWISGESNGAGSMINAISMNSDAPADTSLIYGNEYSRGNCVDASCEGLHLMRINGGESPYNVLGTINAGSGGAGATTLQTTLSSGGLHQGDWQYLIDTQTPLLNTYATGFVAPSGNIPGTIGVPVSVTQSTAWGTLSGGCSPSSVPLPAGTGTQSVTCTVNLNGITAWGDSPGSFTTTSLVCFGGQFHECSYPSAVGLASGGLQTVTFNLRKPHNSGSVLMQGGTQGYADFVALRGTGGWSGSAVRKYLYDVLGAPSTSTLAYAGFYGANGNYLTLPHGPLVMTQRPLTSLSNTGGTVTATMGGGPGNYWQFFNGQPTLYISGSANSAFNGLCTSASVAYNPSSGSATLTCTQSASSGQTSASANVVVGDNAYGNGDFYLWPGAEVLDVQDPAVPCTGTAPYVCVDGYFKLEPNDVNWAAGDTIEEPDNLSGQYDGIVDTLGADNPVSAQLRGNVIEWIGSGAEAGGILPYAPNGGGAELGVYQNNPASMYQYYGGNAIPPMGVVVGSDNSNSGLFSTAFGDIYAPANGGSLLFAGCPYHSGSLGGCGDSNYFYNVLQLAGNAGAWTMRFNPSTSTVRLPAGSTMFSGAYYIQLEAGVPATDWKVYFPLSGSLLTPYAALWDSDTTPVAGDIVTAGSYGFQVHDSGVKPTGGGTTVPTLSSATTTSGHVVTFANGAGEQTDSGIVAVNTQAGTFTGSTTTATRTFTTPFTGTPVCVPAPETAVGAWNITTLSSTTLTVTYTTSGASTWTGVCFGAGGVW